jgi:hypothetical protein
MSMLRKKIGAFYLVERLGSGGMSEVFLGLNPRTREKRAYKILSKRASMAPAAYARFLREVDIMRNLSHPGIIKVLDSGLEEECYYYSMEYMPGGSLIRRMERGKMPLKEAIELFIPICNAMACAHDHAVIHRDLKPANILLTLAGDPIVSDFGIAKVLEYERSTLTQSGEILGTIAYLAPEQRFSSKKVTRRTDVYALGAIFYEMLMGFPPLGKFPWPCDVVEQFPDCFQAILEKCLAINPESRFEDAGALFSVLQNCSGCQPKKDTDVAVRFIENLRLNASDAAIVPIKTDRIEAWFQILRKGTTRERLLCVRDMVDKLTPGEAKAILKLYPEEGDRVRWGLIRVLGELRIQAAVPLIINDMDSPFHAECVLEALGKIEAEESYGSILEFVQSHADIAMLALLPLAKTGKNKAIKPLVSYLGHEMAVWRQAAVQALAAIPSAETLHILKEHLVVEQDEKVRTSLIQARNSLKAQLFPGIISKPHEGEVVVSIGS